VHISNTDPLLAKSAPALALSLAFRKQHHLQLPFITNPLLAPTHRFLHLEPPTVPVHESKFLSFGFKLIDQAMPLVHYFIKSTSFNIKLNFVYKGQ
jgi:hypothetical protein